MSVYCCHRLWQLSALQVSRKRPRRRVVPLTDRPHAPTLWNHVGACDFVFDACANGVQVKCLAIIDGHNTDV